MQLWHSLHMQLWRHLGRPSFEARAPTTVCALAPQDDGIGSNMSGMNAKSAHRPSRRRRGLGLAGLGLLAGVLFVAQQTMQSARLESPQPTPMLYDRHGA